MRLTYCAFLEKFLRSLSMSNLNNALLDYALDQECAEKNYKVAREYHLIGQTAAAISFYLRAAERTNDKDLAYRCMILVGVCFDQQKNRINTVRCAYKHAMLINPKRPEAYFFMGALNYYANWHIEAYMNMEQGLTFADFGLPPLKDVSYPGKPGMLIYKALSSWYWGKHQEARELLYQLKNEYRGKMLGWIEDLVQKNLASLGVGPESQAIKRYSKDNYNKLRFKFKDADTIEHNFSQVYQDMFVLSMRNGKKNGTYLEVGASDAYHNSNSALLEKFGWRGMGIEISPEHVATHASRKNPVVCQDALKANYHELLKLIAVDGVVDYLQLDCEPSKTTFEILLDIPFDDYKFAVITYEHDHYVDMTGSYRSKSRKYLQSMGYVLAVSDVSPDGISTFEDWWVHPELIDSEIFAKMKDTSEQTKHIEQYFLCGE